MKNAYVCENNDDLKFVFDNFDIVNKMNTNYESFVKFFEFCNLIIFFEHGNRWTWDDYYTTTSEYNYILVKTLSRKEKLNRILNYG
jgi:hypothetical protein